MRSYQGLGHLRKGSKRCETQRFRKHLTLQRLLTGIAEGLEARRESEKPGVFRGLDAKILRGVAEPLASLTEALRSMAISLLEGPSVAMCPVCRHSSSIPRPFLALFGPKARRAAAPATLPAVPEGLGEIDLRPERKQDNIRRFIAYVEQSH